MQPQIFEYRGFIIKVMPHALPSNILSAIAPLKYVASIAIIEPGEGRLSDHTRWVHPKGIYATSDEIFKFGSEYAIQMIDDGLVETATKESVAGNYGVDEAVTPISRHAEKYSD